MFEILMVALRVVGGLSHLTESNCKVEFRVNKLDRRFAKALFQLIEAIH